MTVMNLAAANALIELHRMIQPKELSVEQRAACLSVRAHLSALAVMVGDCNDAAAPLRGLLEDFSVLAVGMRLARIEQLLAWDRAARARRPV